MKIKGLLTAFLLYLGIFGLCGCGDTEEAENGAADGDVASVTVYTDAQFPQDYIDFRTLTATAELSDTYGFVDEVSGGVSALDVLIALSEEVFGADFTPDTVGDYLVYEDGMLQKALYAETKAWAVLINGESAHSDEASSYGGFNALTLTQTEVKDGDTVEFVTYGDTEGYSDLELWYLADGKKLSEVTVNAGEAFEAEIQGYTQSFYGAYGTEAIMNEYLAPAEGVQLALMTEDGTFSDLENCVTDADGAFTYTFDEPGEYVLIAYYGGLDPVPAFFAPLRVTVK